MTGLAKQGISRQGLDSAFVAEESRKSDLLLEARLLREQKRHEDAVARFAAAAAIEEQLSERSAGLGLREKSSVHLLSAAGCWAQAGNFYRAIALSDRLLGEADLTPRMRSSVEHFADAVRTRRDQWHNELAEASAVPES
jgi:hypothetical protein